MASTEISRGAWPLVAVLALLFAGCSGTGTLVLDNSTYNCSGNGSGGGASGSGTVSCNSPDGAQGPSPSLTFDTQSTAAGSGGRLTIVAAQGPAVTWNDVCIKDASGNAVTAWAAGAPASGCTAAGKVYCTVPDGATRVQAGDVIDCRNAAQGGPSSNTAPAGAAYDGPFTILHTSANSAFYTAHFHT